MMRTTSTAGAIYEVAAEGWTYATTARAYAVTSRCSLHAAHPRQPTTWWFV
jgi:hypothetical protein